MRRTPDDYTAFFRYEYERVVKTVELIVGDHETALDVTQEAFTRLYRNWARISRYEQPDAWVRRIAINLAISYLRRERIHERALRLLTPPTSEMTSTDESILEAVRRLPPAQRAATVLFYFEDQPSSEIASILECSEPTVRVHLHKARSKLARMLEVTDKGILDVTR